MRVERYEDYLKSHNEWVSFLPSMWTEMRVKDLFKLVTDVAPDNNEHELLSLYTNIGVRPRKDLEARGNKASSTDGYWIVKKGDIIVNKLLAWMGAIGLSEYEGVTSPAYDILRKINSRLDQRFFAYLFRTENAQQIFKKYSRGIMDMRLRLYFDKFGAITIPVPPYFTQKAIADYLDIKIFQIDRKIDLLSQKATAYGKLKQSLINKTVTLGLDKAVDTKDSGVEWIGDVPKHWEVCKLRDITFYQEGPGIMADDFQEEGVPLIRISGMKGITVSLVGCNFLDPLKVKKKWGHFRLKLGELLVSASATTGIAAKVNEETVGAIPYTGLIRFKTRSKLHVDYLRYFLTGNIFKYQIDLQKSGTTIQHYGPTHLSRVLAVLPPMREQKAIADYLDTKTVHIDRIVETINSQIDKLKELRKTLINDVVTGKIKVATEGEKDERTPSTRQVSTALL